MVKSANAVGKSNEKDYWRINPQKAFEVRLRLFFESLLWICSILSDV